MHYSTLIITAEKPTKEDIERVLEPFNEDNYHYDAKEGGIDFENDEIDHERPLFLWDWYEIGGRWDKSLETKTSLGRNIVPVDDLANFDEITAHNCINDVTGEVIVRQFWNGDKFVTDNDYDNKLSSIKERSKGKSYYITMVDIHD